MSTVDGIRMVKRLVFVRRNARQIWAVRGISVFIVAALFIIAGQYVPYSRAIPGAFLQSTWTPPASALTATVQNGWAQYKEKSAGLVDGAQLSLVQTTGLFTHDTKTDFTNATQSSNGVGVVGEGTAGGVRAQHENAAVLSNWFSQSFGDIGSGEANNIVIQFDSKEDPHVVLRVKTGSTQSIKYFRRQPNGEWTAGQIIISGNSFSAPAFTIDANNQMHVVVGDYTALQLKYYSASVTTCAGATCPSASWSLIDQTIRSIDTAGAYPAIAASPTQLALVFFAGSEVRYATCSLSCSNWNSSQIITPSTQAILGLSSSAIAVKSTGEFYVLVVDGSGRAYYGKNPTSVSRLIQIISIGNSSGTGGIAVDSSGTVYITHFLGSTQLGYMVCPSGVCTPDSQTTISSGGTGNGQNSNVAVGKDGSIHIVFRDASNGVKYRKCNGSSCSSGTDVTFTALKSDDSLKLVFASDNAPYVVFRDTTAGGGANYFSTKFLTSSKVYFSKPFAPPGISGAVTWGVLSWEEYKPSGSVAVFVRTTNNPNDVSAVGYCLVTNGMNISTASGCVRGTDLYLQYEFLFTNDASNKFSPILQSLTMNYSYYASSEYLISSPFDTGNQGAVLTTVSWKETSILAGTEIKLQLQTASTVAGLSSSGFIGPDGGTGTYFASTVPGCTKNATIVTCLVPSDLTVSDGLDNQFLQYKVTLTSGGSGPVTADDISVGYVINERPVVTLREAPSQDSTGLVKVKYRASDADKSSGLVELFYDVGLTLNGNISAADGTITTSGSLLSQVPSSGIVQIDNEQISYSGKTGSGFTVAAGGRGLNNTRASTHNSGATIFIRATSIGAGESGTKSTGVTGTDGEFNWTPKNEISGIEISNARVRVSVNDQELANSVGVIDSGIFTLDTKPPALGASPVTLVATSGKTLVTLASNSYKTNALQTSLQLSATDANTLSYVISENDDTFNETAVSYASTVVWPNPALSGDASKKIHIQFKDSKGNTAVGTPASGISIIFDTTAPTAPAALTLQEVSNETTGDVRFFVSWGKVTSNIIDAGGNTDFKQYNVYRSMDNVSFTLITSITDSNESSYLDSICTSTCIGTKYYYKVVSEDNVGNTITAVTPAEITATGRTPDTQPPSIATFSVGVAGVNYVPVEVQANENAKFSIMYGSSPVAKFTTNSKITSEDYFVKDAISTMYVTGLSSGTTYDIQGTAADAGGNVSSATATTSMPFPSGDAVGPSSNFLVTTHAKTAVITGTTDEHARVSIEYGGIRYGGATFAKTHAMTLPISTVAGQSYTINAEDVWGNKTSQSGTFSSMSADATRPIITDIAVTPGSKIASVAWTTAADVSSSFVEYGTERDAATDMAILSNIEGDRILNTSHTVTLLGLTPDTTYYFRVRSIDGGGNESIGAESSFRTTTAGAADTTAPTISVGVRIEGARENGALVTWETNENANSVVEYSKDASLNAITVKTVPGFRTKHAVALEGLTANAMYFLRIKSTDASGNTVTDANGGVFYKFATKASTGAPPAISNISINTSGSRPVLSWDTSESTYGYVEYGFSDDLREQYGSSVPSTSHSVTLPPDVLGKVKYTFHVRAVSSDGKRDAVSSVPSGFSLFTSPESDATKRADDHTPPVISKARVSLTTHNSAVLTWLTNESASSTIEYGLTGLFGTEESVASSTFNLAHSITLSGLEPAETYKFRIIADDAAGNRASATTDDAGTTLTFTTQSAPADGAEANIDPSDYVPPKISDVEVVETTGTTATIMWQTDEGSVSLVSYGIESGIYDLIGGSTDAYLTDHEVVLTRLTASMTYYFVVVALDVNGNRAESSEYSFTTSSAVGEDEALGDLEERLKLAASKKEAELLMKFLGLGSTTQDIVRSFLDSINALDEAERDRALEVIFGEFTGPPKILGSVPRVEVTDSTATITWETSKETTGEVAYASAKEYRAGAEDPYNRRVGDTNTFTAEHRVVITELAPFTEYHFQLIGEERAGRVALGVDRTLKTLPIRPTFTNIRLIDLREQRVTVLWETSLPTKGAVTVTNRKTGEGRTQEDETYRVSHETVFIGLTPQQSYVAQISAESETEIRIQSRPVPFITSPDNVLPVMSQIRTKLSVSPGKGESVQAVISWTTDEPTTAEVRYNEGGSVSVRNERRSDVQNDFSAGHVVVLGGLRPATVYTFRVVSRDVAGNEGISKEFRIFTPRKEESVLELIINNFEETFGFLRKVNR